MTVSSTTRKAGPFAGNGLQTAFPFTFKVFSASDIQVTRADSTGVETVLVLNSNYTVALNADQDSTPGGTVNLSGALATGYALTVTGNMAYSQGTDLPTGGAFNAQNVEDALDRITILSQQLLEAVGRAVKVPATSSTDPAALLQELAADAASAASSAAAALSSYNSFRGTYYGVLAVDPTVDPLGTPCGQGDIYFNSITLRMRAYNGSTWADVGVATPTTVNVQRFSGNGSTTVFTLSNPPAFQNAAEVYISGVAQVPGVDYTVTGAALDTLTFTTAPVAGTNNVFVRTISAYAGGTPNDGSVTTAKFSASAKAPYAGVADSATTASTATSATSAGYATTAGNGGVTSVNGNTGAVTVSSLGAGQTWQDVSASRSSGTTYTNSTSNPIMVNVFNNALDASYTISATVGGVLVGYSGGGAGGDARRAGTVSFVVPPGASYVVTYSVYGLSAIKWTELR